MILIVLQPNLTPALAQSTTEKILHVASQYGKRITGRVHHEEHQHHSFTEVCLMGETQGVPVNAFVTMPEVLRVVRLEVKYPMIGRRPGDESSQIGFEYNGLRFDNRQIHLLAGLCAVDSRENVSSMMSSLQAHGIRTTRMGVFKPRTNPYDFQGMGKACLPWLFEAAGKHEIRVVAMEVTDPRQVDEIRSALRSSGNATGVMLQVGTRNAQNFELLKEMGQQNEFPVLYKRGMGITLEESLNACEYIASEGNLKIVYCLRGVKTHLGDPHRNLVDFAHVPVVRRQTRLPVCVDPSHAVGRMDIARDGLPDIIHALGQGIVAGATSVLIDFHPQPAQALCDGPQALKLDHLPLLIAYVKRLRAAYEDVISLVRPTETSEVEGQH
jgi:3-deoxy-7-phosphoheptulonate synthase